MFAQLGGILKINDTRETLRYVKARRSFVGGVLEQRKLACRVTFVP